MVLGQIVKIGTTIFKYRKYIYRTLVAQDRAIDKAFKIGGYGRQTRYGARHGLVAGTVIGSLLSNQAPDSPGNELPKTPIKPVNPSRTPYKTRNRFTKRTNRKYSRSYRPSTYERCPRPSKYSRS